MRHIFRSSRTGRMVTRDEAATNPGETTRESVDQPFPVAHRDLINAAMTCANAHGVHEALRRLRA